MVDFKKKLGKKSEAKTLNPIEIYEGLDWHSDKGVLRPAQIAILDAWHKTRRNDKDLILKLHTGQGKTLIGLLILQSKLNEGKGPALYLCPNNFLVKQTCEQAEQFGVTHSTVDEELPDSFVNSKSILITSVQMLFNGLTKFGLRARSQSVGSLIMDDAHACIDSIKQQVSISLGKDHAAYPELVALFATALKGQGEGTYADLMRHEYDAILPVPYWDWIDKVSEVADILSRHSDTKQIKFPWPLLKDMLTDCQCVISGESLEISPNLPPLQHFGSFYKATHRVFMSATVTDDSFLVKGLRLPANVIKKPLVWAEEKWSGEKMILIPSLIDESLDRSKIVQEFAKPTSGRKHGTVALCPSFNGTKDWQQYRADIADGRSIDTKVAALKEGNFNQTLVIVNRYDGIDLPDNSCRVLIIDSRPYSESVLDRYMERCLGNSDPISIRTARKIEQGLGRSVRGEKDYCAIILTGPGLVNQLRTPSQRRFFSAQTRMQIEIGLEIVEYAKEDAEDQTADPMTALNSLISQLIKRDKGWKDFYIERMDAMEEKGPHHERLEIFEFELNAEKKAEEGLYDEAAAIIQQLNDKLITDDAEKGWYLQEMARLIYRSSKMKSNAYQIGAHKKNHYLLRPREGMVFQKITVLSQQRVDRIIDNIRQYESYEALSLAVDDITSKLAFGVDSDTFEETVDRLGRILGFACDRPDAEWKEGPDNLWCLRDGQYLLFEAKSQVLTGRKEINKDEADQMNRSVAWFAKNYADCRSRSLMVHPAKKLHGAAAFMHPVEIMRKTHLERLATNVRKFFGEFKTIDFKDISPEGVQRFLNAHTLGVDDLIGKYAEKPRD